MGNFFPFISDGILASVEAGEGTRWLNYTFMGNELWRFGLLLGVLLVAMTVARIARLLLVRFGRKLQGGPDRQVIGVLLDCLAGPVGLTVFTAGLYVGQWCLRFGEGRISAKTEMLWGKVCQMLLAMAVAYFLYRLVDLVEFYLRRLTSRAQTQLDDMLVPIIRKTLRLFIIVVCGLFIADNLLPQGIGPLLATAGIGGLALALAAKDTIANLFGSVTIFADRPFQVGDRIRIGNFDGPVEEVGLRSTHIRTLDGHLVTIPNSMLVNEMVENIGRRPYLKRVADFGVTYDTPADKIERAVQILKDILAQTKEIHHDPDLAPRVYFNDLKDSSLNVQVIYWVKPPDYWLFQEVNQRINLAVIRRFEAEGIEMAYPTRTVYVKKIFSLTGD
jgi:MscS family membrane protein